MAAIPSKAIRIVLIEDQPLLAESIAISLQSTMGAVVLAIFPTPAAALEGSKFLSQAQVALVDIQLGESEAFQLVAQLRQLYPNLRLIWLTAMLGDYMLQRALDARLPGFVHKEDPIQVLVEAIETVASGGAYISESVLKLQTALRLNKGHFNQLLSLREQEVLRHIGSGYSNEEAATLLGLRAVTVNTHRRNIMGKLGLHTSMDLVIYAMRHGFANPKQLKLVSPPPPAGP